MLFRSLEFSFTNPPVHEATFRMSKNDLPQCMRIVLQGKFRKHGKLSRQAAKSPTASTRNFVRDLHSMHVITRLEIKIENYKNDYFRFPGLEKEGIYLCKTIGFNGDEIGAGKSKDTRRED